MGIPAGREGRHGTLRQRRVNLVGHAASGKGNDQNGGDAQQSASGGLTMM